MLLKLREWQRVHEVACFKYERDALDYCIARTRELWVEGAITRYVVRRAEHMARRDLVGCSYRFAVVRERR